MKEHDRSIFRPRRYPSPPLGNCIALIPLYELHDLSLICFLNPLIFLSDY